jgi:hypothetical protein
MKLAPVTTLLSVTMAIAGSGFASEALPAPADRVVDYHKDIAPIFADRCLKCHGEKKQKSDYRLDTRDDAIKSGSEGSAIAVGDSAGSFLVQLLVGANEDFDIMPPKGDPLTTEQIALVRAWIDQGAVWEDSAAPASVAKAELNDTVPFSGLGDSWVIEATTQKGPLATWALMDEKGPAGESCVALTKPNHSDSSTYNVLWSPKTKFQNGELSVALKSISGEEDQGGGLLWRAKDKNNYYVARFNPLEKNLRLYQVKEGKREQLGSADVQKDGAKWATLVVGQQDDTITVTLDGQTLIKAEVGTFAEAGGVGLWTKADAATVFTQPQVKKN